MSVEYGAIEFGSSKISTIATVDRAGMESVVPSRTSEKQAELAEESVWIGEGHRKLDGIDFCGACSLLDINCLCILCQPLVKR
jgi:hypothetical protein